MKQFNWQFPLHQNIQKYLQSCILKNSLNQSYIFIGQKGVGKTQIAELFIRSLKCLKNDKTKKNLPCNQCQNCRQIKKNIHPDIYWLKLLANKKNITVEQIKELQISLAKRSFLNGYKIAVIAPAEKLHLDAANRFLKTLEEPSHNTIIILISHQPWLLPKTIISRCQIIKFLPASNKRIYNLLLEKKCPSKLVQEITALAQGSPIIANYLLTNKNYQQEQIWRQKILKIITAQEINQQLKILSTLTINSKQINQQKIISIFISIFRDLIYFHFDEKKYLINLQLKNQLKSLVSKFSLNKLLLILNELEKLKIIINRNINFIWGLENILLKLNSQL